MSAQNDEARQAFVLWLSLPPRDREPATLIDLADELGVHRITLSRWKQDPKILKQAAKLSRNILLEGIPSTYRAMVESAGNPDGRNNADRRLLVEMAGEYTPGMQVSMADETIDILRQLGASSPWAAGDGSAQDDGETDEG